MSTSTHTPDLDQLAWDNRFTRALPDDPSTDPRPRQVHGAAFSRVDPTPTAAPLTLAWSSEVAELLGISSEACSSDDFARVFSGGRVPEGADPFAMAYGGHQFGQWAGQLGDGRAIALGELRAADGSHQTLQLKGAGMTPYSRGADGRAVLRSSLREFVCSEAMHHLGIPTSRALSLVLTGGRVVRDMFYDGHPEPELGAVTCRVAPTWMRFGTFELPASRGDLGLLRALVAHTLRCDFPELVEAAGADVAGGQLPVEQLVAPLFDEVCARTARLMVDWMRVGFVHGVMNTDNLSIAGLTIDYGPYGWLEPFDPAWTPNTTDAGRRRYRYANQPAVAQWNLLQLANALVALTDDPEPLQAALAGFSDHYERLSIAMLATRLGWGEPRSGDAALVQQLYALLERTETDYVLFHRDLARVPVDQGASDEALLEPLAAAFYDPDAVAGGELRGAFTSWLRAWGERARSGGMPSDARRAAMDAVNPRFVPRNYLAQEAIDACEAGDPTVLHEWLDTLRRPYTEQPGREHFAGRRPEWARTRAGCSMLSCSS